ncbi:hypothetical protein [Clostridium botulinum]|uniref:XRE family transcriptional regulator n=1 Tax=Clostridium botulinum TaxID=1491 RepID=A0A6G4ED45_CLOBO|nr:hypothetical protein [Clostridium botulinum]AUM91546.1 hypothetical protein RSJ5_09765 [Clostridium botulinum]NFB12946.1 XRE family transcriptional regulator [Clostridium botulinum]NFH57876.1 XRE family transcriptional regulator [Clostridium botulinum]NFH61161.1 XRE family transcriptional regulator [Clostridium botulinum]NFJ87251.1 XRE family transcriptional regulator [Clostridium botulinum]
MLSVEESLKELILNKYRSLREFTLKIGMPYSTMDTILKRGVDKANIINILKICNELNISADKLANGIIENKNLNNSNLSKKETILLANFNKLNDLGKNKVITYTKDLLDNSKYSLANDELSATLEEEFKQYLMPIASHDDDLSTEEKNTMDQRINEFLNKHK